MIDSTLHFSNRKNFHHIYFPFQAIISSISCVGKKIGIGENYTQEIKMEKKFEVKNGEEIQN